MEIKKKPSIKTFNGINCCIDQRAEDSIAVSLYVINDFF